MLRKTIKDLKRLSSCFCLILFAFVLAGGQTANPPASQPKAVAEVTRVEPTKSATKSTSASAATTPSSSPSPSPSPSPKQQTDPATQKKPKRGSLVIAPIPIISPAVGSGVVLVAAYVFKLNQNDKLSPPSTVGFAAARTRNGTRGGAIGGRLYFSENKYQTTFAIARGNVNIDFFGIGRIPGREPISVPLRVDGKIFFGEFMRNVYKDVFVGPRFQHRNLAIRLEGAPRPGGFEIPAIDIKAKSVALGMHVQRDKRDSTFYPRKGSLFDFTADFFDQSLGSRRQYQTYKVEFNAYRAIGEKQVLAYRGMACSSNQNVPFYDLCLYGVNSDLRGYTGGEFQNRRMLAAQAEYRRELRGRFGVAAFGGLGGVAKRWNEFRTDELLPAAGAGLRFKLDKKNHINYRIDWAVGREGHTLSIGIGEAF